MKTTIKFLLCFITAVFIMAFTSCTKDIIEGPIGPQGEQGVQGIKGEPGEQGPEGSSGQNSESSGENGATGTAGSNGTNGTDGSNGSNGTDGATGAQGTTGAQGATGAEGAPGTDGTNGTNGTDGNANVIASVWTNLDFPSTWDIYNEARFTLPDANITQEVIDSYALLSYVKFNNNPTAASSVPFISLTRAYEIHDSMLVGNFVAFAIVNNRGDEPNPPDDHQIRYLLIAPSGFSGKNNAPTLEKMIAAGVDTKNYKEVIDYLGLEY